MNINVKKPNKPVIYFAGKIARYDWRTEITGDDRVGGLGYNGGSPIEHQFDPDYRVEYQSFLYGGPFFVSCDHGCCHAREHANGSCGDAMGAPNRDKIFEVNRQRIRNADYMFTFIKEVDCFGTLIELGIAQQRPGLCAAVTFGPNVSIAQYKDLWMAEACADRLYTGPVKAAWQEFADDVLPGFGWQERLAEGLARAKATVLPIRKLHD